MADIEERLLPCPFCGGADVTTAKLHLSERFMGVGESHDKKHTFHRVRCLDCGTEQGRMEAYKTRDEAIAAWNTRTDTLALMRKALEEAEYHAAQARSYVSQPADLTPEKHMASARWHLDKIAALSPTSTGHFNPDHDCNILDSAKQICPRHGYDHSADPTSKDMNDG